MGIRGFEKGARHPRWKGGRSIASNGYVLVRAPGHPDADVRGYIYEHRLVAETMIGRRLLDSEPVHHRNHIKTDNRPENLKVMGSAAEHRFHHRKPGSDRRLPGQANRRLSCACGCGQVLNQFDTYGRPRRFVSGHNGRVQ